MRNLIRKNLVFRFFIFLLLCLTFSNIFAQKVLAYEPKTGCTNGNPVNLAMINNPRAVVSVGVTAPSGLIDPIEVVLKDSSGKQVRSVKTCGDLGSQPGSTVALKTAFYDVDVGKYKVCINTTCKDTEVKKSSNRFVNTNTSLTVTGTNLPGQTEDILGVVRMKVNKPTADTTYGPIPVTMVDGDGTKLLVLSAGPAQSFVAGSNPGTIELKAKFLKATTGVIYQLCIFDKVSKCSSPVLKKAGENATLYIDLNVTESIQYSGSGTTPGSGSAKQSCGSVVTGTGWLLCPVVNSLAGLNDTMWEFTSTLLTTNPLQQSDATYAAWGVVRSLANVLFVIFFLIIIFSQLTSVGITNYGIKKLLPRLIICAIAVNLSYIIVQVLSDLANIVGSGLYDLIIGAMPGSTGAARATWSGFINELINGSLVIVGVGVAAGAFGGLAAIFWIIAPMAAMAALGLFAAILTLGFRQAAIPILAIMAPLAFVAYLLPNTEKWFQKWRELLMAMLMLYPLAAIIFAGSKFASNILYDQGGWWFHLIANVIMALPLFSLPFLARSGGAIMSSVSGALNKVVERARNPIEDASRLRRDAAAARYRADENGQGGLMRNWNRRMQARREELQDQTKADKDKFTSQARRGEVQGLTGRRIGQAAYQDAHDAGRLAGVDTANAQRNSLNQNRVMNAAHGGTMGINREEELSREEGEEAANLNKGQQAADRTLDAVRSRVEDSKQYSEGETDKAEHRTLADPGLLEVRGQRKAAGDQVEKMRKSVEGTITSAGTTQPNAAASRYISAATQAELQNAALQKVVATKSAEHAVGVQDQEIDVVLAAVDPNTGAPSVEAVAAGGIAGAVGVAHVQALSTQAINTRNNDAVTAAQIRMKDARLDQDATRELAMGRAGPTNSGLHGGTDPAMRQAAARQLAASNDVVGLQMMWDDIGTLPNTPENTILRNTFADSLMAASGSKPLYYGAGGIEAMRINNGHQDTATLVGAAIDGGAYAPAKIAGADKDELALIMRLKAAGGLTGTQIAKIKADAAAALADVRIGPTINKNRANMNAIAAW